MSFGQRSFYWNWLWIFFSLHRYWFSFSSSHSRFWYSVRQLKCVRCCLSMQHTMYCVYSYTKYTPVAMIIHLLELCRFYSFYHFAIVFQWTVYSLRWFPITLNHRGLTNAFLIHFYFMSIARTHAQSEWKMICWYAIRSDSLKILFAFSCPFDLSIQLLDSLSICIMPHCLLFSFTHALALLLAH